MKNTKNIKQQIMPKVPESALPYEASLHEILKQKGMLCGECVHFQPQIEMRITINNFHENVDLPPNIPTEWYLVGGKTTMWTKSAPRLVAIGIDSKSGKGEEFYRGPRLEIISAAYSLELGPENQQDVIESLQQPLADAKLITQWTKLDNQTTVDPSDFDAKLVIEEVDYQGLQGFSEKQQVQVPVNFLKNNDAKLLPTLSGTYVRWGFFSDGSIVKQTLQVTLKRQRLYSFSNMAVFEEKPPLLACNSCAVPLSFAPKGEPDYNEVDPAERIYKIMTDAQAVPKGLGWVITPALLELLKIGDEMEYGGEQYVELVYRLMGVLNGCPHPNPENENEYFITNYLYSIMVEALQLNENKAVLEGLGYSKKFVGGQIFYDYIDYGKGLALGSIYKLIEQIAKWYQARLVENPLGWDSDAINLMWGVFSSVAKKAENLTELIKQLEKQIDNTLNT